MANKKISQFSNKSTPVTTDKFLLEDILGNYYYTTQSQLLAGASFAGTTNRITVSGGTIDIASTYIGQNTITTLGTIGTGVWQGTSIGTSYTDAKIKGGVTTGQIGYASATDTLASSSDFTFDNSTKLAYLNGRIGVGIAAISATIVSLKGTTNNTIGYLLVAQNSDSNLIVRTPNSRVGDPTGWNISGTAFAHCVGMFGFESCGQNEIYYGANSYGIDSRAQIRFHTSGVHQFIIGEVNATAWGIYTNTGSNWAFHIDTAGTAYLNNKVHVRGYNATYGIAPLNVYAKTSAEGYNYGWSAALNVVSVGSSCYPSINLISAGSTNFSAINWQDTGYDALTASTAGNQAYLYCYNSGGKGYFVLGVNNNIGTTSPAAVIEALGTSLTLGASGGSLGFYGTTPIAKPTTAIASATFAGVGGTSIATNDTFGGYTLAQIAKALINLGILT